MDEKEKNIDESWKEAAEKEKLAAKQPGSEAAEMPAPTFSFFITTLALQAAIAMGQLQNPATDKTEENLPQAKFIIDTLDIIKTKTQGNLTKEEETALQNILYELKISYVNKTGGGKK